MSGRVEWCVCALIASIKLWPCLILLFLLPGMQPAPSTEVHDFKLGPQAHRMLLEGAPAFSYGTEWTIEIPAPSSTPSSVDIRAISTYVYKYIAFNLSETTPLAGGFQTPSWTTSFELEGIDLGSIVGGHPGYPFVLEPQEYFWGPERPKVTDRVRGVVEVAGGWPDPGGDLTWTLRVRSVSHFNIWSSGTLWFGQSMKQRVRGQVQYTF